MSKQLLIKPEKCLGCRTCELMCSFSHHRVFNPSLANVSVWEYEDAAISIPMMCMQCEEAACMKVCPVGAITRNEIGAVVINEKKCIVCKMCMNACPLGNVSFKPQIRKMSKCNYCDGDPQCAKFCPTGAIVYSEPEDDVERRKAVANHFKDVFGEEEQA